MSPEKIIKAQARDLMKKNYFAVIAGFFILVIALAILDFFNNGVVLTIYNMLIGDAFNLKKILFVFLRCALTIITFLIISPMFTGYIRLYYNAALTGNYDINDVFYYFTNKHYKKAFKLNLLFLLIIMIPLLIAFLIPNTFIVLANKFLPDSFTESIWFYDIVFLLTVFAILLLVLYMIKYFCVYTMFIEHPDMPSKEYFSYSKKIMHNNTKKVRDLIFSFTPWLLLCLTILPLIYVVPYITQSLCISSKWLNNLYKEEIKT